MRCDCDVRDATHIDVDAQLAGTPKGHQRRQDAAARQQDAAVSDAAVTDMAGHDGSANNKRI